MEASTETKQLYNYLQPLGLSNMNRPLLAKLNFDKFDLNKDLVFCCKRSCANEVFLKLLFALKTSDSYKVIPLSRLSAINDAYKTGYVDPDYGALAGITDTKILFITSGGFEVPSYIGNILDVLIQTRRSAGLKTFIFHLGDKTEFLSYKSTSLTEVYSLSVGGSKV